jgi:hypothetical protein
MIRVQRLKRVSGIGIQTCRQCGVTVKAIAGIAEPGVEKVSPVCWESIPRLQGDGCRKAGRRVAGLSGSLHVKK